MACFIHFRFNFNNATGLLFFFLSSFFPPSSSSAVARCGGASGGKWINLEAGLFSLIISK